MFKEQKGITLIALVITIIVLLILAGVTIAMLTGENGILNRATSTRGINEKAQADEQAKLAYMAVRTDIAAEMVNNGNYSSVDSIEALNDTVIKDLGLPETGQATAGTTKGWTSSLVSGTKITMTYKSTTLKNDLTYTITMTETAPYATFADGANNANAVAQD